jgi:hypothetical protein
MSWTIAFPFGRVSVRCSYHWRVEPIGTRDDLVEVGHFAEPQQDTIAYFGIRVDEQPVVVGNLSMMELQGKRSAGEQSFVV